MLYDIIFIFKKALTPFLLPPGIFITLLLLSGYVFFRRKKRKAARIHIILGLVLWAFTVVPISDALLRSLESGINIPDNPKGDMIILLGGGVYEGATDLTGLGAPSEEMLARIITAVRLQKKLNIPIIVSGGAVFKGKKAEAPIVKRFITDLGIPEHMVIVEDKSRDTIENAKYSLELCKRFNCKEPILVTSSFHMKRSVMSFEKVGLKVMPVPAGFKTWADKKYIWEDFLPHGLENMAIAMREYIGLFFYKIFY